MLLAAENLSSWPVASAIGTNSFNNSNMIKFVEEQTYQVYGKPIRILCDAGSKFDCAVARDCAESASIDWKITSAYNPRGNSKVERMVGTLKRAIQKVVISCKDRDWDECLSEVLGGYCRRTGTDEKYPFETLLGIRPRFAVYSPQFELIAFNTNFFGEFDIAIAKSLRALRIVPAIAEKLPILSVLS